MSASPAEGFHGCSFRSDGRPALSRGEVKHKSVLYMLHLCRSVSTGGGGDLRKKACEKQL